MSPHKHISGLSAAKVLSCWPKNRPLSLLASHGGGPFGQFSMAASHHDRIEFQGPQAHHELSACLEKTSGRGEGLTGHGWVVVLGYELGRAIEPSVQTNQVDATPLDWPEATLLRCEGVLASRNDGPWQIIGDKHSVPTLSEPKSLQCIAGDLRDDLSPEEYQDIVSTVIDFIHAGDCFQANVAHRFSCPFSGSVRALAHAAFQAADPRYGAHIETGNGRTAISMSPELFLDVDNTHNQRVIRTRPIKGTRPAHVDPQELDSSSKDKAELAMIVDLMRNDLGRICSPGSVEVITGRTIESHQTIHHGVAEIRGTVQPQASIGDIITATFPPGSVTGAPKVRAMQIIESLEQVRRGPYCGAMGWIDDSGMMVLNVGIRTISAYDTTGSKTDSIDGYLEYQAGCGIVADSEPSMEYQESIDKTEVFRRTLELVSHQSGCP